MSNVKKRPRSHEAQESNSAVEIVGRRSVEADEDSSFDPNEDVTHIIFPSLSRLNSRLLRKIFSYASHDQLALELPLVCQKWYEVVCYSDSLWEGMLHWLNTTSPTVPNMKKRQSVFRQQFKDDTHTTTDDRNLSELFGTFTITTNALRKFRHRKPSLARRKFIAAYRRQICCGLFFREMGVEETPSVNHESRALLKQFQEKFNIRLPLGFLNLLQRHKVHRYIPHLWYADLEYDNLDFIELSSNRILLLWAKDCQDCWYGFILFDRYDPVPDPPVYADPQGVDFPAGFFSILQRRHGDADSSKNDDKTRLLETLESQLVLENPRLSSFLEQYATEAKHWDMDDANSSLQAEDAGDLLLGNESDRDEISDPSSTVRRSKRLRTEEGSRGNSEEEEQESSDVEYEDFGLRHHDSPVNGTHSDDSSGEEEWKDTD